jgi:hypothetical protein
MNGGSSLQIAVFLPLRLESSREAMEDTEEVLRRLLAKR